MALFRKPRTSGGPSPLRAQIGRDVAARLGANPAVTQAPSTAAAIFLHPNFLSPAECDALIALIDARRRPSTLLSDRAGTGFRNSESADLDRWSPEVRPTDEKIARLLGIDPDQGETIQGQRYAVGQQFRTHHDFFHENEGYYAAVSQQGGQRTWTAMVYLNDVPEGGATWFPQAGVRAAPRRGLLLAWNNMRDDGSPNLDTLHEGMAVVEGTKYIITKWFREGAWVKR